MTGYEHQLPMSGSDGDIKSRRPAMDMPGPAPFGRTSSLSRAGRWYPRYSCTDSRQDRQAGRPLQGIANSCTAYVGCMAYSLRDGTAVRAVKAARAWPPDKPGWASWAHRYINKQPGWQSSHTHMTGKQCTVPLLGQEGLLACVAI